MTLGSSHRALFLVVVALPFLLQAFPTPGAVPTFLPIALILAPATLLMRIADKGLSRVLLGDPWFMAIAGFTVLTYIYGMAISIDFQVSYLVREIANGVIAMAIVFAIANSDWKIVDNALLTRKLAVGLVSIAVFVAAVGAFKFWAFLSNGTRLEFVVAASGDIYPWGTSLVADYNFYSLTLIVGMLSALYLCGRARPAMQASLALIVVMLLLVGALAGSRRFWLIAPILVTAMSFWMIYRLGIRRQATVYSIMLLGLVGVPLALYAVAGNAFESILSVAESFQYRLYSLVDSDGDFGMGTRYEFWAFAVKNLDGAVPWIGDGFDYMNRFSCEFGKCTGDGYPHMPILSGFLYGGLLAAIATSALYLYITLAGFRLLKYKIDFGWLFFPLLAALMFAAVSGNGSLSIRSFVVLGALCVGLHQAIRTESAGGSEISIRQ